MTVEERAMMIRLDSGDTGRDGVPRQIEDRVKCIGRYTERGFKCCEKGMYEVRFV